MMMSMILLRTCQHGKVIAAQARIKLPSAQSMLLMHVEILQSKNTSVFFFFLDLQFEKLFLLLWT